MISILIPSRNRPKLLAESIACLEKTAAGSNIEYLVKLDDDDSSLEEYDFWCSLLVENSPRIFVTSRNEGYRNLHLHVNYLAEQSTGDWLQFWNDDCLMETEGWDEIIERQNLPLISAISLTPLPSNLLPCISRGFYDVVGHFSLNAHIDTWIEIVAAQASCQYDLSHLIKTNHFREQIFDDTRVHSDASCYITSPEFYLPHNVAARNSDVQKLIGAINELNRKEQRGENINYR